MRWSALLSGIASVVVLLASVSAAALAVLMVALMPAAAAPASTAPTTPRILYSSDWPGPTEIFAADPAGQAPVGQLTTGRPAQCGDFPSACGYAVPLPSPDGRRLLLRAAGIAPAAMALTPTPAWVAAADGGRVRTLGPVTAPTWSPDSTRIAYAAPDGVHIVRADGTNDRIVDHRAAAGSLPAQLAWSPRGDALAFAAWPTGVFVLRSGHERRTSLPAVSEGLSWSPDGRWLAVAATRRTGGMVILVEDVSGPRRQPRTIGSGFTPVWAPRKAQLAYSGFDGIHIAEPVTGRSMLVRHLAGVGREQLTWSPSGRLLAYNAHGIHVIDVQTRHDRRLSKDNGLGLAWAPDGSSLAYIKGVLGGAEDTARFAGLRTVTLTGRVRAIASPGGEYGGQITSFAWTTPPAGTRYRAPQPVDGVFAGVQWLAADGGRVTWSSCKQLWTWTPGSAAAQRVDPETGDTCYSPSNRATVFGLAVASDRVVWGEKTGGLGFRWTIAQRVLTATATPVTVAEGTGVVGSHPSPAEGTGTLAGAGSLIVVSSWQAQPSSSRVVVSKQTIERVDPSGSLVPLASSPGPFTAMDVSDGRIVTGGDNDTIVLDADGHKLLTIQVSPAAAQLDGTRLVVLVAGELRDYDADGGALLHTWPLPAVSIGRPCSSYGDPTCPGGRLVLHDAAHGLAAYVLDGKVHLLRLSDGRDAVVARGSAARFLNGGLAYADGARVHMLPSSRLPLSSP